MAGDAASVTVRVLLQNLIDISKDEISLIRGLEEDADNLMATLTTIQSFLDDDAQEKVIDAAVKTWLNELEEVAFDADNVLDELNYRRLADKMKSIQTKKKKVPSCFPSFNQCFPSFNQCFPSFNHCVIRRDMAVRIKKLNTNFKSINERATMLGLERKLADALAAPEAALESDSFTVDPIFIGRDDQVSEIVEMLTTPTEEVVSIVPIVGMGGLGKTTLTRNVFNHQKIKTHFGQHIWVHVSENFGPVILLKKILTNLTKGSVGDESKEVLLSKLQQALGDKTYLLVLDDVWNEDRHKWEDFINSWIGITSTKGNGIIVTTRNTGVGLIVKRTLDIHHLEGLSDEECWSIIKDRALEIETITPDLKDIRTSIGKRCQGLPLAANVVGAVLRGQSQSKWLSVKENWLSDVVGGDENNISNILKLSFHHLSSPTLKKCFAYCSTFPKGYGIEKEKLIELWMAEGFLQHSQTSDHMENGGEKFFNLLEQNSLLQRPKYEVYYSMHDLAHDLASSVLGAPVKAEGTYRARYIYLEGESCCIPKEQAKWLRTLIYNVRISDILFSEFKSLHALTLISYHEELPDSIRELIHLRSLDISNMHIKKLPESVGELYHLQTLRICWGLKMLPSTLSYLFNLRHLRMEYNDDSTELPPHLGKLTSLQTLTYFNVRKEEGCRIEELGSLENLKGQLIIYNLEKVEGEEDSRKACLFQKSGIVKLTFWC